MPKNAAESFIGYTICPADNATAGSLGRRRAGQLRFGFVAVLEGHIVHEKTSLVTLSLCPRRITAGCVIVFEMFRRNGDGTFYVAVKIGGDSKKNAGVGGHFI
jgi:hypothetical protein